MSKIHILTNLNVHSVEPMGRVSPKFPTGDISRTFVANKGDGVPLLCPAQGFPAPAFRYLNQISTPYSLYWQNPWAKYRRNFRRWKQGAALHFRQIRVWLCSVRRKLSPLQCSGTYTVLSRFYVSRACGLSITKIPFDGQLEEFQYYV